MDDIELSRSKIEELINEWILNERDRKILKRRMCDGVLFDDLAAEFYLSVQRIKAIVYKGKDTIYRHIKD